VLHLRDPELLSASAFLAADSFTEYKQLDTLDCAEDIKIRLVSCFARFQTASSVKLTRARLQERLRLRRMDYARQLLLKNRLRESGSCPITTSCTGPVEVSRRWKLVAEQHLGALSGATMSRQRWMELLKTYYLSNICLHCNRTVLVAVDQVLEEWKTAPKDL
jgi:hypothetical protein